METNALYTQKFENYQKAINRQEADWVPNAINDAGGGFFWGNKSVYDVAGNHLEYAKAMTAYLDEMWADVCLLSCMASTPRRDAAFPTAENRIAPDGTVTHLQTPFMKPDEYDQLIADPKAYIANVLLPRKYPYLYEDRETAKAALKVFAEEQVDLYVMQAGFTGKYILEKYGIPTVLNAGVLVNTPLDHLFDFFRGFRGTLTDLRRQPDKVKAALEAIWNYKNASQMAQPFDPAAGIPFQPCHIPAYLSPKQFKELYWPYEKKLIEWINANGSKHYMMLEGRWGNIWECFLELPKDSVILHVDDDDFLKAHEVLGDHQILVGGLKIADTRLKKFEDIKDSIKRVIDTCAPGGGYIFSTDKYVLAPGDMNPTLVECYNFAHEYSKK